MASAGAAHGFGYVVFAPQDAWFMSPDGRIAVVRSGDYHVEWHEPNGRIVRGPPVPSERLPVTMAERMAYVRNSLENSNVGGRGSDAGLSAIPASWLEEKHVRQMAERNTFAETKPPFTESLPHIAPDGALWVERSTKLGESTMWDMFDSAGRLTTRVRLPVKRRLAGFGARWIYLIATDEDGLQRLERYRLSSVRGSLVGGSSSSAWSAAGKGAACSGRAQSTGAEGASCVVRLSHPSPR